LRHEEYEFSFSGLKTAVALFIQKLSKQEFEQHQADIAASFQEAVVEILVEKTVRAAAEKGTRHVTLSGGVAANSRLRQRLSDQLNRQNRKLFYPSTNLCTDNAAMIAAAGYFRYGIMGPGELIANAIPYLTLDQA